MPNRTFAYTDQSWFARVTGDANPLHVDAAWAAANFPGELVVHGVHALLWGLDACLKDRGVDGIEGLEATFVRPILLGDVVTAELSADNSTLRLLVEGEPMTVLKLLWGSPSAFLPPIAGPKLPGPVSRDFEDLRDLAGTVPPPPEPEALTAVFPAASAALGPSMLASLASLSTLVGMECPGLRGFFSQFILKRDAAQSAGPLTYRVTGTNARFRRVDMKIGGCGVSGMVYALIGQTDESSADDKLHGLVSPDEFGGSQPLILGAATGLGAITARLLAAGGAQPLLTWRQSREAIDGVARSITAAGGQYRTLHLEIGETNNLSGLADLDWQGRELYYFATPRIFRRRIGLFQAADLHRFLHIYVDGFHSLVTHLMKKRESAPLKIFYPSSTAITEDNSNMLEYVMAKEAGERLCSHLQKRYSSLSIVTSRLPRMVTPQTRSFLQVSAEPPEKMMLPIIREMQKLP